MVGTIIKKVAFAIVTGGYLYMHGYIKGYAEGHSRGSGLNAEEYLKTVRDKIEDAKKVNSFMEDYETFREGIGA